MARFAVHLGIPPKQYWGLTLAEHDAIVTEFERAQKAKR